MSGKTDMGVSWCRYSSFDILRRGAKPQRTAKRFRPITNNTYVIGFTALVFLCDPSRLRVFAVNGRMVDATLLVLPQAITRMARLYMAKKKAVTL